ncbi:hypothetical protein PR202_gb10148 [Eleusine coracana subsp. coracana]|uniref:Transcription factor Iwr1 domain-containing protein n=1 Tax=Eleusine coracana subsp. coracana TaxID=191504 RepID=A0AAV5EHC4_ELECO|nr:hypothetical protein PR202_gb10148 [Eleusine coracana subsp. coracana]
MRKTHRSHEPERPYRSSGENLLSGKRISQREPMNVTAGGSDLRHRLLKQRRLSNPISTQAQDRHDAYVEDRQHRRGNEQAAHDGLTRSRLHGRIKLPGETSFDRFSSRSERGPRARLSPPKHTDLRGKLHERLKARSNENIRDNAKDLVKKTGLTEDAGSLSFAGPKSLAELKAKKVLGSSGEDAISNTASFVGLAHRASETVDSRDSSESSVPFEGPKSLSVILKREREKTPADCGSIQEEEYPAGAEGELQILESDPVELNMEANGEDEDAFHPEDDMEYDDNFDSNAVEYAGQELEEPQDQEEPQDEEYEYDAGDMNANEDNDYQEYEDDDDLEDDDDFARKVGVVIS